MGTYNSSSNCKWNQIYMNDLFQSQSFDYLLSLSFKQSRSFFCKCSFNKAIGLLLQNPTVLLQKYDSYYKKRWFHYKMRRSLQNILVKTSKKLCFPEASPLGDLGVLQPTSPPPPQQFCSCNEVRYVQVKCIL